MVSPFNNPTLLHDKNLIGNRGAGKPVRNKNRGFIPPQPVKLVKNFLFGNRVKRSGRFIEDQNIRIPVKSAGKVPSMALLRGI